MSARSSAVKLSKATKVFLASWQDVKAYWRDSKGREFEKRYIQDLPDEINTAMKVIEEIDKILTKARHDCE